MGAKLTLDDIYEGVRCDPYWDLLRLPGIALVPGFGASRPSVLIVGEAPGATENTRRRPFCGASGVALHELMAIAGLQDGDRSEGDWVHSANAYITNVVKYRPPGNRTPTRAEIEHGRIALRQEWAALGRPAVLVAAGSTARSALVPGSQPPAAGHPVLIADGVTVWPMYHPAYPLRQRSLRPKVEKHWEKFGEWLKEHGHVE